MTSILIINGHPDGAEPHFCDALADAYATGARAAGHAVSRIDIADDAVGFIHSQAEWSHGDPPDFVTAAQRSIAAAEHLVFVYPLWLGAMPAKLKAWLEQVLRPDFIGMSEGVTFPKGLKGRSARIVVTMGMPAPFYRLWYGAHSVRSFDRNILHFVGVKPVRWTLLGMVEGAEERRTRGLARMAALGRAGR